MKRIIAFLLLLCAANFCSYAQKAVIYTIHFAASDSNVLAKKFHINTAGYDSTNALITNFKIINKLNEEGYISAYSNYNESNKTATVIQIYPGEKYYWIGLRRGNVDQDWLSAVGFRENIYSRRLFSPKELSRLKERLLIYAENNGYPFAKVALDSVEIGERVVSASLNLVKHDEIKIDSISNAGSAILSSKYLYNYLGVKKGGLYNEAIIAKIPSNLKGLTFIEEQEPLQIAFIKDRAVIKLQLRQRKSNQFNFLLGVLPGSTASSLSSLVTRTKLLVSGEGLLRLENIAGTGNLINADFKINPSQTQQLNLRYMHPFVLGLPAGTDLYFTIIKHDSTYIDVAYNIGAMYLLPAGNYAKFFMKVKNSNVLTLDTAAIKLSHRLPPIIDFRSYLYGVEWKQERLDYRFNPSKGYSIKVNAAAGYKLFKRNTLIANLHDDSSTGFVFSSLYDTIPTRLISGNTSYDLQAYYPLYKRTIIYGRINGAWIADPKIYSNELFRIGGNKLLRGFDEESIFCSFYQVNTMEVRYLLGTNSNVYSFFDYALLENKSNGGYIKERPYGFGAGFSFETKAGIFGISYALGARKNAPIQFRSAKVHFGYVVNF